nr:UvrD-helicase domain-containing protein [Aeromicrobium wangtongii]
MSEGPAIDKATGALLRSDPVLAVLSDVERDAVDLLGTDFREWIRLCNEQIVANELVLRRDFFDSIESSPLTEEQARAVICFDNRVNVVAAAGSGKTSVMVARAAYAIERGFVQPERILLLAFNKAAAKELQERVTTRLGASGIPAEGVKAATFHSFGLTVIGAATGRKPRLASWLDAGEDTRMIMTIVDELRDRSWDFRFKWDVFRLLYARVDVDPEHEVEPDAWDKTERRTGLRTFNGEVVKSQGERLIADWLYLNGINYQYERPYERDVATADYSEYRPDFYYPDVGAWHEHWAIGFDGKPPADFEGYEESMRWKKSLHAANGSTLIETTWADIISLKGFDSLAARLKSVGLTLDWNPDRPIPGEQPVRHEELARLMRTFMAHVKSNSLDRDGIQERLRGEPKHVQSHRTHLFLDIYWAIHDEWQDRLLQDGSVDFEDMLVAAAQHIERGDTSPSFDLVLVDEFQDASQARARLVAGVVKPAGRYLLAVGDDWQAINRFAGADISVMTEFERWFGRGHTLRLQTTFRCTQRICDVSSAFVSKNPRQIAKRVVSVHGGGDPVLLTYASSESGVGAAIETWLQSLARRMSSGEVSGDPVTVYVLGRYWFDTDLMPKWSHASITVTFRTVHGSKGLEADYVIVPNLGRGRYGFPSQIADDPILGLAMGGPDQYEHAEERRLFYVALTRARRQVVLIGVPGAESPFLTELLADDLVTVNPNGYRPPVVCPRCGKGTMVGRSGPHGRFLGCTEFPRCRHTAALADGPR